MPDFAAGPELAQFVHEIERQQHARKVRHHQVERAQFAEVHARQRGGCRRYCCRAFAANEDAEMIEHRVCRGLATHDLVPVPFECLAGNKGLAHAQVGILEIHMLIVHAEHDDVMAVVPVFLRAQRGAALTAPDLGQRDHRVTKTPDLVEAEVIAQFRL
ncbi:MAG: hypothetical protein WAR81_09485, partial [Pseudomonadales bacterium]